MGNNTNGMSSGKHANFLVESDVEAVPSEATDKTRRLNVSWQGRAIAALSQNARRAYLYPVLTPAGVAVTGDGPVDHPHHQSITIGTDRLHCLFPLPFLTFAPDRVEEGTYNFWMDKTYLGRAPGRIIETSVESHELSTAHLRIVQTLEWRGPSEWGAPEGRLVVNETRTIDVYPGKVANIFDIRSQLAPTQWDLKIGPTLHAYFAIRMADGLRDDDGATLIDSLGRTGASQIDHQESDWVDCSGKLANGEHAGLAVCPHASVGRPPWHLSAGGTLSVNPFLVTGRRVNRGELLDVAVRIAAHDGDAQEADVAALFADLATTSHH
jgi:hypothetical protein